MGDFRVIGDISESVKSVIERDPWEGAGAKPRIAFRPSGDITGPSRADTISILLVTVTANSYLINAEAEPGGSGRSPYPPLILDLYYLITAYSSDPLREQHILGKVMEILDNHSVMSGPDLQGSLAGTDTVVHILFHSIPRGELINLWTSFHQDPPRLSVCYCVTPVRIDRAPGEPVGVR